MEDSLNALIKEFPKPNLGLFELSIILHPSSFEILTVLSVELSSIIVILKKPLDFKLFIVSSMFPLH